MTDCRADMAFFDPVAKEEIPNFCALLSTALNVAASMSRVGAIHFLCADWRHFAEFMAATKPIYGEMIDVAVWVKSKAGQGALYRGQHEFIGVFRVGKEPHHQIGQDRHKRSRPNVWHYAEVNSFGAATSKPVALSPMPLRTARGRAISSSTLSGFGTTIMAAEHLGRHARALELEPRFVDLAIHRWQTFTRRDARHAANGSSFNEIAADRTASALANR